MTVNTIHVKTGKEDIKIASGLGNRIIDFTSTNTNQSLEKPLWLNRDFYNLEYQPVLVDLFRLATSVFIIDKTIPRIEAYDRWTRDIELNLPVSDPSMWYENTNLIVKFLSFLTGDHWKVLFTQDESTQPQKDRQLTKKGHKLDVKSVSLFSGGLDSFIGVVDQIVDTESVAMIAHYDQGQVSKVQKLLHASLVSQFPSAKVELLQFFVQPLATSENTMRSRSLLFLSLGSIVASSIGVKELVVPENSFISLNVPLTYNRLGSLSTRTTHPNTLNLFNRLLQNLRIDVLVSDPYKFKTKGEMLSDSKSLEYLVSVANETMSCAHANVGIYQHLPPNRHCGYCLPCLIRRAAFHRVGLDDPKHYTFDVLDLDFLEQDSSKTSDLRAVLHSIENHKTNSTLTNILKTGPIFPINDLENFCKMYNMGIQELESFLSVYKD